MFTLLQVCLCISRLDGRAAFEVCWPANVWLGCRWDETRRSSRRRRRRTIKARRSRPSLSPVHQLAVVEHFLALCGLCTTAAAVKTGSHSSELHLTRLLHPLLVYTANISTRKRTAGAPTCERMRNPSQLWNQNQTFEPEIWGSVCLL